MGLDLGMGRVVLCTRWFIGTWTYWTGGLPDCSYESWLLTMKNISTQSSVVYYTNTYLEK